MVRKTAPATSSILDPAKAVAEWVTPLGMRVRRYEVSLDAVPVDFFADPDGAWSYESLVQAAGFVIEDGVGIGALSAPFGGHPEGAAVVTLNAAARPYVAIIECPIAYAPVEADSELVSSAA
jgi:hypothetical protein